MSNDALKKTMDLIARRDHSELELRTKLASKFSSEEIDYALERAWESGWMIAPDELAQKVALRLHEKGKGHLFINQYLKKKGLPGVDKDPELEYKKAQEILAAAQLKPALRDRLIRKLFQRGFEPDSVWRAVNELKIASLEERNRDE